MDQEYALHILRLVETKTLESKCALAKEAYRYLKKLKSTNQEILDRIYIAEYKKMW